MNELEPTIFIVDDDPMILSTLRRVVESAGLSVETFESAPEFLAAYSPERLGCLVLDVGMPGMSGLDLQDQLAALKIAIPIIVISGSSDVAMAVRAMRAGAIDFIEKPFISQVLLERVQTAVQRDRDMRERRFRRQAIDALFGRLTPREREVMGLVVQGKPNKEVAAMLSRSEKTVEFHRAQVMKKMEVQSFAELVRLFHEREEFDRDQV